MYLKVRYAVGALGSTYYDLSMVNMRYEFLFYVVKPRRGRGLIFLLACSGVEVQVSVAHRVWRTFPLLHIVPHRQF